MLTPIRTVKRQARRDLHSIMQIPAVYLASRAATATLVHVRLHNIFNQIGDVKGARLYPADVENISPKIIFDLLEQKPAVGALVCMADGEVYSIDHTVPADDQFQTAYVTQLFSDRAANLPYPSDDGLSIVTPVAP